MSNLEILKAFEKGKGNTLKLVEDNINDSKVTAVKKEDVQEHIESQTPPPSIKKRRPYKEVESPTE